MAIDRTFDRFYRKDDFLLATDEEQLEVAQLVIENADYRGEEPRIDPITERKHNIYFELTDRLNDGKPIALKRTKSFQPGDRLDIVDLDTQETLLMGVNGDRGRGTFINVTGKIDRAPKVATYRHSSSQCYLWEDMVTKARELGYQGWAGVRPEELTTVGQLADYKDIFSDQQMAEERVSLAFDSFKKAKRSLDLDHIKAVPPETGWASHQFWHAKVKGTAFERVIPAREPKIPQDALDKLAYINQICAEAGIPDAFVIASLDIRNDMFEMLPNAETPEKAEEILFAVAERVPGLYAQVKYGVDVETHATQEFEYMSREIATTYKALLAPRRPAKNSGFMMTGRCLKYIAEQGFEGDVEAAQRHFSTTPEVLEAARTGDSHYARKNAAAEAYREAIVRDYLVRRGGQNVAEMDMDAVHTHIAKIHADDKLTEQVQEASDKIAKKLARYGYGFALTRNGSDIDVSMSHSDSEGITFSLQRDTGVDLEEIGLLQDSLVDEKDSGRIMSVQGKISGTLARQILPALLDVAEQLTHPANAPEMGFDRGAPERVV